MQQVTDRPWLVSGFFSLLFPAAAALALNFSGVDRSMPLLIAILASLLSLGQLITDLRQARGSAAGLPAVDRSLLLRMLAWLALLTVLCAGGGLTLGCGLFITLYLRLGAGYRWRHCFLAAVLFSALQYTLFTVLLDISLYRGPVMIFLGL